MPVFRKILAGAEGHVKGTARTDAGRVVRQERLHMVQGKDQEGRAEASQSIMPCQADHQTNACQMRADQIGVRQPQDPLQGFGKAAP